jgi:4-amino-4-deoxy-L-arabinose transferase-like glycosyltransferase
MPFIQDWIHRVEEGGGLRYLKYILIVFAFVAMILSYNYRGFKNMSNLEAMDTAQLARNISEHRGYKTQFVRPFSIYLLQKAATEKNGPAPVGAPDDRAQLHTMHPDISNPPVYPLTLAGLMKVLPFKYSVGSPKSIWNRAGAFWMYEPDFVISVFNQFLFFISVVLVFFIARRLFDSAVAWTSAAIYFGTDLFWRFSISGLSTMLVIVIFLTLIAVLVLLEQSSREGRWNQTLLIALAAVVGACIGIGALTRYSFGVLILPVLLFYILFLRQHRVIFSLATLAAFAIVLSPWVFRNYRLSHTAFGTAQYAMYETVTPFTEHRLERSLKPDLSQVHYNHIWFKFLGNFRSQLTDDLPRIGGNWISGLFLAGLLIRFKNPGLSRLRYFLLFALLAFMVTQALCRTQLSEDSPTINSENLLAILAPMVIIYGVSLFFTLLDQIHFPLPQLRWLAIGGFCVVLCLPMILTFVSPRVNAIAYPPYYPPILQKTASWMKPDELIMSDVPAAVAWYGNRQCIWITLNAQEDFFAVNDYMKQIKAVYLTPQTMDSRFLSQWVRAGEHSWGSFILESMVKKELPPYFPLKKSPSGFLPEQLFLTDRDRWSDAAGQ